jgi:hypothetical protein
LEVPLVPQVLEVLLSFKEELVEQRVEMEEIRLSGVEMQLMEIQMEETWILDLVEDTVQELMVL